MQLPLMGNVRELENLLQRMLALSDKDDLDIGLLNELYSGASGATQQLTLASLQEREQDLDSCMQGVERQLIDEALNESGGSITRAAEKLGITFRSLRYRLKKMGLDGDE